MKKILLMLLCLPVIVIGQSSGTGFAINSDGYIATNFHVIDGADIIQITGINGEFENNYEARIIKIDKSNDLAILKIDKKLGAIPYGFKNKKEDIASTVYAYGYPLPEIQGYEIKITDGIINSNSGLKDDPRWYQHTASIQPGNSGGPLINKYGNLIGVNNAGLNNEILRQDYGIETENINYAIKSRYLYSLMEDLELPILLNNGINKLELSEQYKNIHKFVYLINVKYSDYKKRLKITTNSRIEYKIIKKGSGYVNPKPTSKVTVHYEGRLVDGTVFDSSYERNKPATFPVNGVIPGWVEALQLMVVGDKWTVTIPPNLAYGERGAGGLIGPNETLIFDIELLDVKD